MLFLIIVLQFHHRKAWKPFILGNMVNLLDTTFTKGSETHDLNHKNNVNSCLLLFIIFIYSFFNFYLFLYAYKYTVCMQVCVPMSCNASVVRRGCWIPPGTRVLLELEFWMVLGHHVGAGDRTPVLCKSCRHS